MLKVASIEQTRAIEASADADGISYVELMQRAGRAAADRALTYLQHPNPQVTVLVGSGNNGGDGMVAGLLIAQDRPDANVRFYQLKQRYDDYTQIAREVGILVVDAESDADKRLLRNMVASSDLIIDALYGIGVRLPLSEEAGRVLRMVKQAITERQNELLTRSVYTLNQVMPRPTTIPILALDVPSGVHADTGALDRHTLTATETLSFITAKRGLFTFPAASAVGKLSIATLDLPDKYTRHLNELLPTSHDAFKHLPQRPVNSHKGTFGKLLIIGGSPNYWGAPLLSARAAYAIGTGLVTLAVPEALIPALATQLPEATWEALNHHQEALTSLKALEAQLQQGAYTAILVGTGLGQAETTRQFLYGLLEFSQLPPLILDADALNLLAQESDWWKRIPAQSILTPHPAEMARLCQLSTQEIQSQRWQIAQQSAERWNAQLVLKGAHTLITTPDGTSFILPFKTSSLAKAGTGDVLAGLIAGLVAQKTSPITAAWLGAYLHGMAGEQLIPAQLASHLIDKIGQIAFS